MLVSIWTNSGTNEGNILLALTKLNSHWVAAPRATLVARKRAVGISLMMIQQAGPQPNWKKLYPS